MAAALAAIQPALAARISTRHLAAARGARHQRPCLRGVLACCRRCGCHGGDVAAALNGVPPAHRIDIAGYGARDVIVFVEVASRGGAGRVGRDAVHAVWRDAPGAPRFDAERVVAMRVPAARRRGRRRPGRRHSRGHGRDRRRPGMMGGRGGPHGGPRDRRRTARDRDVTRPGRRPASWKRWDSRCSADARSTPANWRSRGRHGDPSESAARALVRRSSIRSASGSSSRGRSADLRRRHRRLPGRHRLWLARGRGQPGPARYLRAV